MGKTGTNSWLNAVKKAFRSPSKNKDEKKSSKRREEQEDQEEEEENKRGKRRWVFRKSIIPHETTFQHIVGQQCALTALAMAAEATARAAAEVIRLTSPPFPIREHHYSAVLIQTAFRGYLARRALGALKGLVKLQALVRGQNVRKQARATLQYMQALMRVQDRICNQRKISVSKPSIKINVSIESKKQSSKNYFPSSILLSNSNEQHRKVKESVSDSETEIDLANAFAHQMRKRSGTGREYRENIAECSERDDAKIVEIDTMQSSISSTNISSFNHNEQQIYPQNSQKFPHNFSVQSPALPLPPSLRRTKPLQIQIQMHSTTSRSGYCFGEDEEERKRSSSSSVQTPARYSYHRRRRHDQSGKINNLPETVHQPPKYMAATASANARLRSVSAPRQQQQRPSTPEREVNNGLTEKKRLSFADVVDSPAGGGAYNFESLESMLRNSSCKLAGKCVHEEQKISSPSSGGKMKWLR